MPTFLISENCAAGSTEPNAVPAVSDELATRLTALSTTLLAARSSLNIDDVGQLLELLADRHFLEGSPTPFSKIATLHPPPC